MPFRNVYRMTRRFNKRQQRIKREEKLFRIFEQGAPDLLRPNVSISTLSGSILSELAVGVQNTIVQSLEYVNSDRGSDEATLILNEPPPFPLAVYSKMQITVNNQVDYTGYMWKPKDPGNPKNNTFKYEFFGLRKLYETFPINTTQNFIVTSIVQSGVTTRFNLSTNPSGVTTNQMLASRNCDDSVNNLYAMITGVGANFLDVTNPAGVNQAGANGDIRVLPEEWSSSNLISDIFKHLVQTWGANLGISYDPTYIEASTGVYTLGYIDLNDSTMQQAIDKLEKIAAGNFLMGVNRAGYYFFKKRPDDANSVLNVGYQIHDFELSRNFDKIINVVDVRRAKGHSEGGNGWITASSGSDPTSIAKYGRRYPREAEITIPEFFSDTVADLIRDSVLESYSEPKYFCKIKNLRMDTIYDIGDYIVSTYPDTYSTIFDDMDSFSGWTFGANVGQSLESTIIATGSKAFKFSLTSLANGQTAAKTGLNFNIRGKKRLMFWMRGTQNGTFLNVEISDGTNTYDQDIYVNPINLYYYFQWDISGLNINKITSLTFTFQNITTSQEIYIDEISVEMFGSLQIRMPFKKVKTMFKAHQAIQDLELGLQFDKLSEYMQGIQSQIASHNLFHKDRSS